MSFSLFFFALVLHASTNSSLHRCRAEHVQNEPESPELAAAQAVLRRACQHHTWAIKQGWVVAVPGHADHEHITDIIVF